MTDDCPLTDHELRVVELLSRGYTVRAASRNMQYSERTIKTWLSRAREKTGARNSTELVATALRMGWVE